MWEEIIASTKNYYISIYDVTDCKDIFTEAVVYFNVFVWLYCRMCTLYSISQYKCLIDLFFDKKIM